MWVRDCGRVGCPIEFNSDAGCGSVDMCLVKQDFSFYSICIALPLNSNLWRVATALGSRRRVIQGHTGSPAGRPGRVVPWCRHARHPRSPFTRSELLPDRTRLGPRVPEGGNSGSQTGGPRRRLRLSPFLSVPPGRWRGIRSGAPLAFGRLILRGDLGMLSMCISRVRN